MTEAVLHERHGPVSLLTLNAPATRNALAREVQLALLALLEQCGDDSSCRAIILRGADGNFCSGGDINNMKAERTLADGRERVRLGGKITRALVAGPKPVIAAVEGYAVGAGLSLAAASDYVVSSSQANYMSAFGKVGLLPDMGLLWSLSQRVGIGQAKRLIASCRKLNASDAFALGLVDHVCEPDKLFDTAMAVASDFCVSAPLPTAMMKAAFAGGLSSLEDALRCEMDNQSSLYLTRDHREAVAAFLEKRSAEFKGC